MGLESLKRDPIGVQTLHQLKRLISSGEWAVGQRIPGEPSLSQQLGVGRSTIREAVRALVYTGVLETRPGDGTYVRASTEIEGVLGNYLKGSQILEIYEVRRAVEMEAARLACERRTERDLELMRAALADRRATRDVGSREFLEADMRFHLAIVDSTRNPVLGVLYRGFMDALEGALVPVVERGLQSRDTDEMHAALYEAIEAQDAEAAAVATQAHLDSTARALAEAAESTAANYSP